MSKLTGKTRFRPMCTDTDVLLVLQVEVAEMLPLPERLGFYAHSKWRDATVSDLCEVQHLTYSNIRLTARVQLPDVSDAVPGEEKPDARKLH
jgi:hypothetical protein